MKLGRACAAGAVLWAVALPLTAGTALADQEPAPVAEQPSAADPTAAPADTAPPSALPDDPGPVTVSVPPPDAQVSVRPEGAPETGGGPEETGIDLAVAGGTTAVVAVAAGGAVLLLRRRRAGAQ
ncbi:hypothetical protein [Actinophytocola glycyrrhizae]|uniref:Gram-positive cocci surface proteins LPxTG domain-containing protein n=1 Tax=Actinophytocola glycyrrhizae TaxID=2044873 RepID=A0ABV9RUJ1_9PSEU